CGCDGDPASFHFTQFFMPGIPVRPAKMIFSHDADPGFAAARQIAAGHLNALSFWIGSSKVKMVFQQFGGFVVLQLIYHTVTVLSEWDKESHKACEYASVSFYA